MHRDRDSACQWPAEDARSSAARVSLVLTAPVWTANHAVTTTIWRAAQRARPAEDRAQLGCPPPPLARQMQSGQHSALRGRVTLWLKGDSLSERSPLHGRGRMGVNPPPPLPTVQPFAPDSGLRTATGVYKVARSSTASIRLLTASAVHAALCAARTASRTVTAPPPPLRPGGA